MAARRGPGRPPKKRPVKRKLGKASALPDKLWTQWLDHVRAHGSCWLYVALLLTHLLCLRITEALRLTAEDFAFGRGNSVYIKPLKGQPALRKPMLPPVKKILLQLKNQTVKQKRIKKQGALGEKLFLDCWKWPQTGPLFPAERADSDSVVRNKNTVCKAIGRLRCSFEQPCEAPVRSHSGRHRMVSDLKMSGVADDIGMCYARIKDKRTYAGYGKLSGQQAWCLLKKNAALGKALSGLYGKK